MPMISEFIAILETKDDITQLLTFSETNTLKSGCLHILGSQHWAHNRKTFCE